MTRRDENANESSWRSKSGNTPDPSGGGSSWRQQYSGRNRGFEFRLRWSHLAKGMLSAAAIVVCGALILWIGMIPGCTRTELLVASAVQFQNSAVRPRTFAESDRKSLQELKGSFTDRDSLERNFSKSDLATSLQKADKNSLLVVYLSAPAGVLIANSSVTSGKTAPAPAMLLNASDPDEHTNLYTLDELWTALKSLPAKQHKLLLLDVPGAQSEWRLGMLENWFLDEIQSQFEAKWKKRIPRLTIICSSSPGEKSWGGAYLPSVDDPRGRSAFADSVIEGLSGHADTNHDQRIEVPELFRFLKSHTCSWVSNSRDVAGQHPLLLEAEEKPNERVFIAVSRWSSKTDNRQKVGAQENRRSSDLPSADEIDKLWKNRAEELDRVWKEREKLAGTQVFPSADAAWQYDPLHWRLLTNQLLRAEDLLRAHDLANCESLTIDADATLAKLQASRARDVLVRNWPQDFVARNIIRRMQKSAKEKPGNDGSVQRTDPAAGKEDDGHLLLPAVHLERLLAGLSKAERSSQIQQVFAAPQEVQAAPRLRDLGEDASVGMLGTILVPVAKALVFKGDEERRGAEDQMFISRDENVEKRQARAGELYERALGIQRSVHDMRCMVNQLRAEIPELAVWAAHRPSAEDEHRKRIMNLFAKSNGLPDLNGLQALEGSFLAETKDADLIDTDLLILYGYIRGFEARISHWNSQSANADVTLPTGNEDLKKANDELKKANDHLVRIKGAIKDLARSLAEELPQPNKEKWLSLDQLLQCPVLSPEDRRLLNLRHVNFSKAIQLEAEKGESHPCLHSEHFGDPRCERARWQGLWAILAVSRGRDLETAESETKTENRLWERWRELPEADGEKFRQQIVELGDAIRGELLANRMQIQEKLSLLASLQTGEGNGIKSNSETALQLKKAADREVRNYLDLCALQQLDAESTANPAAELREHAMEEMLLSQTARYLNDFWVGWYDQVAEQCLEAAKGLDVAALRNERRDLEATLDLRKKARGQVKGELLAFGSQMKKDLPLRVSYTNGLPKGKAAVWLELPDPNGLFLPKEYRQPVEIGDVALDPAEASTIPFTLDKTRFNEAKCPDCVVTAYPRTYFRGHRWAEEMKAEVKIDPCRPRGVREEYEAPAPKGTVVVSGHDDRVILFILDCSKSMEFNVDHPDDKNFRNQFPTRFDAARRILTNTLRKLADRPPESDRHRVGLMAYGNRGDRFPYKNGEAWKDVETISEIQPLDERHLRSLGEKIKNLQPLGNTPLFHSLKSACQMLKKSKTGGTIVVVTDGVPNDDFLINAPTAKPTPEDRVGKNDIVREILQMRELGLPVELRIVAFQVDQERLQEHEQVPFADMRQLQDELENRGFDNAKDADKLASALEESVSGRYEIWSVGLPGNRSVQKAKPPLGKVASLAPGAYEVHFAGQRMKFRIAGGEALRFRRDLEHGLTHERPLLGRKTESSKSGLSLGYQNFTVDKESNAQFVLSLENDQPDVVIDRPEEIEFEVTPAQHPKPLSWRWQVEPRSLPTWRISIDNWPLGDAAEVKAFWKPRRTDPPDWKLSWASLQANAGKRLDPLELDGGERLEIKILKAAYDEVTRRARIEVQIADFDPARPRNRSPQILKELEELRIQMKRANVPVQEFTCTRDFIEKEELLIVDILIPEPGDLNDWEVLITSWRSRKKGAIQLLNPLRIEKTDREGASATARPQ